MKTYIATTKEFDRGVYAYQDIKAGELIENCHILVLSEQDTAKIQETELQFYDYTYNEKQSCLVLGNGELYNHSDSPNTMFELNRNNNTMAYYAISPIKKGQQIFIDYNADIVNKKDVLKTYTTNLM